MSIDIFDTNFLPPTPAEEEELLRFAEEDPALRERRDAEDVRATLAAMEEWEVRAFFLSRHEAEDEE